MRADPCVCPSLTATPGADLLNIYMKYCSFGKGHRSEEMDCSQFAKLCHESGLLNGKTVTKATCDIVWFRCVALHPSAQRGRGKGNCVEWPNMAQMYHCRQLLAQSAYTLPELMLHRVNRPVRICESALLHF